MGMAWVGMGMAFRVQLHHHCLFFHRSFSHLLRIRHTKQCIALSFRVIKIISKTIVADILETRIERWGWGWGLGWRWFPLHHHHHRVPVSILYLHRGNRLYVVSVWLHVSMSSDLCTIRRVEVPTDTAAGDHGHCANFVRNHSHRTSHRHPHSTHTHTHTHTHVSN